MTEAVSDRARRQLKRLISDGLAGRKPEVLFVQLVEAFMQAGERLSIATFRAWLAGESFPATRKRQNLLGRVVGGSCGEAIGKLPSPAFRGWRRRVMKETEEHMTTHAQSRRDFQRTRQFPTIGHLGEDGRKHLRPVIECAACHTRETVVHSSGVTPADQFEKKGWEVGRNHAHDLCPMCIKARDKAKVVKMEDHVKNNGAPTPTGTMSKEDGRILSRLIEDHWDDAHGRYQPGYSDAILAKEVGRPIEWVKERRELDFGGSGEDPGLVDFIQAQVALDGDMGGLKGMMEELAGEVSGLASQHQKVQRLLEKYRDAHLALQTKANKLSEVAGKLTPPFKAAG